MNILKRIKTNAIISAILYVLLGLALLLRPELSTTVLCTALGVVLILRGLSDILDFVFHRDGTLYYSLHLVAGIVLAAVGVWLVTQPTLIAVVIPCIIGIVLIYDGISDLWITSEVSKAVKLADKELQGEVIDVDYKETSPEEDPFKET